MAKKKVLNNLVEKNSCGFWGGKMRNPDEDCCENWMRRRRKGITDTRIH
jgi:hypothetical protein